jgi:hypothetical protein
MERLLLSVGGCHSRRRKGTQENISKEITCSLSKGTHVTYIYDSYSHLATKRPEGTILPYVQWWRVRNI